MSTKHTTGAVIARVEAGSPAERAGLRSGDLVIAANGVPIRSGTQLRNTIGLSRIGDQVDLTVDRRGAEQRVSVSIAQASAASASTPSPRQRAQPQR